MTHARSARRWRRIPGSTLFAALVGLVLAAVIAACEVPSDADKFATAATSTMTTSCSSGQTLCGDADAGVCTDTQTDPANCGSCGMTCPATFGCVAAACACTHGFDDCGGVCSDLSTDHDHCGSCANACDDDSVCVNAGGVPSCEAVCQDGETTCSNACVDLNTDNDNCGGCNARCPAGNSCVAGTCTLGCAAPQTLCGSGASAVCANTSSNKKYCGVTCAPCGSDEVCSLGRCTCDASENAFACGTDGACEVQAATHCGPQCVNCQVNSLQSEAYVRLGFCTTNTNVATGMNNAQCTYPGKGAGGDAGTANP